MRLLLLLLLHTIGCTCVLAQPTGQEVADAMGRGINLGNTLEPPTEGAWNNGPAQERYFNLYREAGFTNVRIPVRWGPAYLKQRPLHCHRKLDGPRRGSRRLGAGA